MSNRQNLSLYTETDTASRATITSELINVVALDNDESCLVTNDFTVNYFSADFEHSFEVTWSVSSGTPNIYLWGVANEATDLYAQLNAGTDKTLALKLEATHSLSLYECDGTNTDYTTGSYELVSGKKYFIRVCRNESVGTYGTLYVYLYQDASCCVLLETITHTLEIKTDFRYLFAFAGQCSGTGGSVWTGSVEKLTLEAHPYTLANMILLSRYYLREATASMWSDVEITSYINRSIREIAQKTGCIQHIDTITTTSGQRMTSYTGYKVVAVEYIPSIGRSVYIRNISPLMVGHVFTTLSSGEPQYWFEDGGEVGIEPIPNSAYTLRLYIADFPTGDMSVATQVPEIPPAFHWLIILYTVYLALLKDKKFSLAIFLYSLLQNDLSFNTADKIINIPVGLNQLRSE